METIDELKKRLAETDSEREDLLNEIKRKEDDNLIDGLEKRYCGKFLKIGNELYIYVKKVRKPYYHKYICTLYGCRFIVRGCETTMRNGIKVKTCSKYVGLCASENVDNVYYSLEADEIVEEITRDEFFKIMNDSIENVKEMIKNCIETK